MEPQEIFGHIVLSTTDLRITLQGDFFMWHCGRYNDGDELGYTLHQHSENLYQNIQIIEV